MFTYRLSVRYAECDAQGVLFNAHYLTYCDHAMDEYLLAALGAASEFQVMVKAAALEWHAPLKYREVADIGCVVSRWGTTSMDVEFTISVNADVRCVARITYVCVTTNDGRTTATAIPADVRTAFAAV